MIWPTKLNSRTLREKNAMGWLSGIADDSALLARDAGDLAGDVKPIKIDGPTKIPTEPMAPIEPKATPPVKPAGSSGTIGAAAGAGIGGVGLGFALPTFLNSSAVSSAINAAAGAATVATLGDDVKDILGGITSSPVNMTITAAAAVAVLYLVFRR